MWKGDRLPPQPMPLWLPVTSQGAVLSQNASNQQNTPGKRKGAISETSVGSHSGQLLSYHGNPPLETASISGKQLQTIISINEKWYTVASKLYLLLYLAGFSRRAETVGSYLRPQGQAAVCLAAGLMTAPTSSGSLIKFLDVTLGEASIREANV